ISFQPVFQSGRVPNSKVQGPSAFAKATADKKSKGEERLNTADIILAAVGQSQGKLRFEDFTPLRCGDPNCATIGYLLKLPGGTRSISDFVDFSSVQGFLRDRVQYTVEDLAQCGCESEPLGHLLKELQINAS